MRELVDQIHSYMWEFLEQHGIAVEDPSRLRRNIQRQVTSGLTVISPMAMDRMGYKRVARMIDTAGRYNVTLAELLNEALQDGEDRQASLAKSVYLRKEGNAAAKRRSHLRVIQ